MPEGYNLVNREIDSRLVARFSLSEVPTVKIPYIIPKWITPITNIDALLRTPKAVSDGEQTPTGTGYITMLTVPDGKRWWLYSYKLYRSTGAAELTNQENLYDSSEAQNHGLGSYTPAAGRSYEFNTPIPLDEGDYISTNVSTHNAGDKLTMTAWVEEEDAY